MTTTPEPRELAAKILDRITQYPDNFDMNSWMDGRGVLYANDTVDCGTTLCVAGWAAHLSGWALVTTHETPDGYTVLCERGEEAVDPQVLGSRLLGLSPGESSELFFETNPRIATEMVRQLANGQSFDAQAAFEAAYPGRSSRPRPA